MTDTVDTAARLRQIDALVAEHVFGARVMWGPKMPMIHAAPGEWGNPPDIRRAVFAPRYTTSWDAAGQVVEKVSFRQDSTVGTFRVRCHGWLGKCWDAGWVLQPYGDVVARAETFPLAVCLAALKALGVEVPD